MSERSEKPLGWSAFRATCDTRMTRPLAAWLLSALVTYDAGASDPLIGRWLEAAFVVPINLYLIWACREAVLRGS